MTTAVKNTHTRGLLKIHETHDGSHVILEWEGKSVDKNPGDFINPILARIAEYPDIKKIEVDLTQLQQMNSSTMPSLIIFMKNLERNSVAADFIYSPDSEWQRISLQMLANLAKIIPGINVFPGSRAG